jgi:hypothetical protein
VLPGVVEVVITEPPGGDDVLVTDPPDVDGGDWMVPPLSLAPQAEMRTAAVAATNTTAP